MGGGEKSAASASDVIVSGASKSKDFESSAGGLVCK